MANVSQSSPNLYTLSPDDKSILIDSIHKQISKFASDIMVVLSKYQLLDNEQIALLTDRNQCRNNFNSDYAMLLEVSNDPSDISRKIHDKSGHTRYYGTAYNFNGHFYVMTSQLYGPGGTHKDNKTPFYEWVLNIAGIDNSSLLEHTLGKFYSWEVFSETTAVKYCDKSFFECNGSGVPKEICWFWGAENMQPGENISFTLRFQGDAFSGRVSNESSDRHRVRIFWYSDLANRFNQYRHINGVRAMFRRVATNDYEVSFEEGESEMPLTNKETLNLIKEYIDASGFSYEDGLVENFYLSLKSKPFVILAGTSGTGKTKLVKLFSEAIGAEYKLVPVRPDWSDSSDLFGHVDLNGKFVPGPVIDFLVSARNHPQKPHLLCLDEMNLARVEYYLSDFLSIIETRKMKDGEIVSAPLMDYDKYGADAEAQEKYGRLEYPSNLYVIGTVNMDETTFPFSKKVLDRANTIEFSHVNLIPDFGVIGETPIRLSVSNSFLKTDYLILKDCADHAEYITGVCSELEKINRILQNANAHVGYRVRDEIIFYMLNNRREEDRILPENEALDNEIMQKILPRIQGSSSDVYDMLCELFIVCGGDYTQKNGNNASEKMCKLLEDETNKCKYRKSAEKLKLMAQRFEQDGFTSYWL